VNSLYIGLYLTHRSLQEAQTGHEQSPMIHHTSQTDYFFILDLPGVIAALLYQLLLQLHNLLSQCVD